MYSNRFTFLIFLDGIILHTSTNDVPPFWMRNGNQISIHQILLLFFVEIPHQGTNITIILNIISNIPPVILPYVFHYDILLLIQVWVSIFQKLLLNHIHWYLLDIIKTIKYIKTHNSFKHVILFINRIPINSQRFTLFFLWKVWYWLIHLKAYLLFWT